MDLPAYLIAFLCATLQLVWTNEHVDGTVEYTVTPEGNRCLFEFTLTGTEQTETDGAEWALNMFFPINVHIDGYVSSICSARVY